MTELPDNDAPLKEWLRPVSATMINKREIYGYSGAGKNMGHGGAAGALTKRMRAIAKKKADRDA